MIKIKLKALALTNIFMLNIANLLLKLGMINLTNIIIKQAIINTKYIEKTGGLNNGI